VGCSMYLRNTSKHARRITTFKRRISLTRTDRAVKDTALVCRTLTVLKRDGYKIISLSEYVRGRYVRAGALDLYEYRWP
jgi:hypothetical protein